MRTNRLSFIVTFFSVVLVLASLASAQTATEQEIKSLLKADVSKFDHDGLIKAINTLTVGDSSLKDAVVANVRGVCNEEVTCLRAWVTTRIAELSPILGTSVTSVAIDEPRIDLPEERVALLVDEIRELYPGKSDQQKIDFTNLALALTDGDVAKLTRLRDTLKPAGAPAAPKPTSSTSLAEGQEAKVEVDGDGKVTSGTRENVFDKDPGKNLEALPGTTKIGFSPLQSVMAPPAPRTTRDEVRTALKGRADAIKDGWNDTVDEARAEVISSEEMEAAILKADEAKWEAALKQAKREIFNDTKDSFLKAELKKLSDTDGRRMVLNRQQSKLRRLVNLQGCGPETILDIPPARFGSEYLMTINYNNVGYTDVQVRDLSGHALVQNLCEHAVFTLPAYIRFADGPYVVAHYTVVGKGPDGRFHHLDSPEFQIRDRNMYFGYFTPRVGGGDRPTWEVRFPPVSSLQPAQAAGTRTASTGTAMKRTPAGSIRPQSICGYMPNGCK